MAPPMIPDDFFSDAVTYTRDDPPPTSALSAAAQPAPQELPSGSLPGHANVSLCTELNMHSVFLQLDLVVYKCTLARCTQSCHCAEDYAGAGARTDGSGQQHSFEEGICSMEAGSWDGASASFSDALHNSQGDAKVLAAQYLAAVMLCKVPIAETSTYHSMSFQILCLLTSHVTSAVLLGFAQGATRARELRPESPCS